MKRILITGATGNIGIEVVHYLAKLNNESEIILAVRNIKSAEKKFASILNLSFRLFDFEKQNSFDTAFKNIDILFLLRPPQISKVDVYFKPLLESARNNKIEKIVFLSVQGAEKSKVIPHNKIEHLIKLIGFEYIFVRPSYFMQNLTTTLLPELQKTQTITLPSGNAKFNWIDVKNIGEITADLINSFENYKNKAYEITGTENKNFQEVSKLLSDTLGAKFKFKSINPIRFYFKKRKEGVANGFAIVMTILHFLPRLQKKPKISENFTKITGKKPTTLKEFIVREKETFTKFL
ncbi:NmrA family NAD(P)-binding protein [Polaribacter cellanae]|uniref:NmrA family NAD(P)-binding protein n=1 Tax=Polaribacter cellanae TaxID=2818493 RepID=A0A975CN63_9FLAO|nr:NmrA family NAD(P)-binding protein [Polaribacter cellanae]QTE22300.1 NmrA family NAD(P)-binding protein [Polaribacter cellanae]